MVGVNSVNIGQLENIKREMNSPDTHKHADTSN